MTLVGTEDMSLVGAEHMSRVGAENASPVGAEQDMSCVPALSRHIIFTVIFRELFVLLQFRMRGIEQK